jgi:molybdopterin-synthase adenylyltransferase
MEGKVPTAPTIASMMGALEVQEALKLIHGMPVAAGSALVFNGVTNQFYRTQLPHRPDCLSHETYPEPIRLAIGHSASAAELFPLAARTIEGPFVLALERDVVTSVSCPSCGWSIEVHRPRTKVTTSDATCPNCKEIGLPVSVNAIEERSHLAHLPLAKLGIPAGDIVRIDGATESGFFQLLDAEPGGWTIVGR